MKKNPPNPLSPPPNWLHENSISETVGHHFFLAWVNTPIINLGVLIQGHLNRTHTEKWKIEQASKQAFSKKQGHN
jgi:hypothetical protein